MATFEVYIHDDRWGVPTLHFPVAVDKEGAIEWALDYLLASPHHTGAEVWQDGVCIARLDDARGDVALNPVSNPVAPSA